jgi:acyl-coenzyme A synthetase/AMP-(fatty) acid ligase
LNKGDLLAIDSYNKVDTFLHIVASIKYGLIPFLYDFTIPFLNKYFKNKNIPHLEEIKIQKKIKKYDFPKLPDNTFCVLFTSGSTGVPTGLIKTKDNIINELEILDNLLKDSKSFTSTVPFIHIYGFLFAVLLPLYKKAEIYINENYYPNDFLNLIKKYNIDTSITNPIFIKICSKLKNNLNLNFSKFISSTMPLSDDDAKKFTEKFSTSIIQFYGSTETGGIAFKKNYDKYWTTFKNVKITEQDDYLYVTSPLISPYKIEKDSLIKLSIPFKTEDLAEIKDNNFQLIGRSSNIIKVAGKRISTKTIEHFLKRDIKEIQDIQISVENSDKLKSESLIIYLVSDKNIDEQIYKIIKLNYPAINMKIKIKYVKNINTSSSGKKVLI